MLGQKNHINLCFEQHCIEYFNDVSLSHKPITTTSEHLDHSFRLVITEIVYRCAVVKDWGYKESIDAFAMLRRPLLR